MQFDPQRLRSHVLEALRPFYFSDDVDAAVLAEAPRHLGAESPRALFDLSLRLHWRLPERGGSRSSCWAPKAIASAMPDDVRATARHHGVDAMILPGLAHMMMLERGWEAPAQRARSAGCGRCLADGFATPRAELRERSELANVGAGSGLLTQ